MNNQIVISNTLDILLDMCGKILIWRIKKVAIPKKQIERVNRYAKALTYLVNDPEFNRSLDNTIKYYLYDRESIDDIKTLAKAVS